MNEYKSQWFTLVDAMREYPELKTHPEFNGEYGISAEYILEMIAKTFEENTNFIAEKNNRDNKYTIDFKIIDKKNKNIIAYCDMESDFTGAFESDGTFKWWDLTIPIEKKKYLKLDKPFFYIKFSRDFKWCYILDVSAAKHKFKDVVKPRNMKGTMVNRGFMEAHSSAIFNRKEPYGIHRCPIQEWWKAVGFFMKKRNDKENEGIMKWL